MLDDLSFHIAPVAPAWLVVLVALALLAAIAVGTVVMLRRHVGPRWALALAGLRLGAWLLFLLILLQPAFSTTRTAEPRPELLVLVDRSSSMAQPSGSDGTRLDEVRKRLDSGEFAAALGERFRPHWFAFDRTAFRVDAGKLPAPSTQPARLADSLRAAHAVLRAEDVQPQRVLLVSDGNDHGEADAAEVARQLGLTVDVLAPTAKAADQTPTVRIADVQGARRVLLGSETHFRVTVRAEPPPGAEQKMTLRLVEDGKALQSLPVVLKAGQAELKLLLAHRPGATGLKTYEFDLQPTDAKNAAAKRLPVDVIDGKYEVLVLEDTWRWEYKFLHRLFEDDPAIRFTALLPRGAAGFAQFASPDRRVNLVGFPQGGAELEGFDLFFLGDVNPARWPRGLPAALARLIVDEGKSLVVIAGPNLGNFVDIPELHALLPVDLTRGSGTPVAGSIDVLLRPDASSSPFFFQLAKDTADLPPLDHVYPALRKRPGATVLLEAAKHRNEYGPLIVMAEHTVGRGKVLFVGTDTLWKWHTLAIKDGPTPYSTFWQQTLRALTPQRSQVGAMQLWLTPSRSRTTVGGKVEIEAEIHSDMPLPSARLQASVGAPDGKRWPLSFAADPGNPRRYRASFTPSVAGTQQISATLLAEGKTLAEGRTTVEVESADATDAGINYANLRRITDATGGKWIDPANPQTWPVADESAGAAVTQRRMFDLWGSFTLLLLLCGVLGADWFIRLFKGFV